MLREIELASPITITRTTKGVVEVAFREADGVAVCFITYSVPDNDGSTRLRTVRKPVSAIFTTVQFAAFLDKAVSA